MDNTRLPDVLDQDWLHEPSLKRLMQVLNREGEETRIVGGAVRDALLGYDIGDIDLATTAQPLKIKELCQGARLKTLDTGIDHGTISVFLGQQSFEVTSLREDVETDGRRAKVIFGRDWKKDAKRRDFTMNALFIDADGKLHDPLGGYHDLVDRRVRFIDQAQRRIEEDYLRVLRFFRFFAWYGNGRPDRDALRAIVRAKQGLRTLSSERIWKELKKLLQSPEPERAVLWMNTTEVLSVIMPENWGLDQFHWLIKAEREQSWQPDALLRLQAMIRPDNRTVQTLADRLKLSNFERMRLAEWVDQALNAKFIATLSSDNLAKVLYRSKPLAILDVLRHEFAKRLYKQELDDDQLLRHIAFAQDWQRPVFPVKGKDLLKNGEKPGRLLGRKLKILEDKWVESGFSLTREALLSE